MNKITMSGLLVLMHTSVLAHESGESIIVHALEHGHGSNAVVFSVGLALLTGAVVGALRISAHRSTERD